MKLLQIKKYAKDVALVGLLALTICVVIIGCKKKDDETSSGSTPVPTVYVKAEVQHTLGLSNVMVMIFNGSTILNNATVTVNGSAIPYYASTQIYQILIGSPLSKTLVTTPGSNVTLQITSSVGNFSASGVMPASGASTMVSIPGCTASSQLILTSE